MGGWGEVKTGRPGDVLASVVERYLNNPTTGNRERLEVALREYKDRIIGIGPPPDFCV